MRFTDKKTMARFIELVKTGAPVKSYREIGLTRREQIQEHLGYLESYEDALIEKPKTVATVRTSYTPPSKPIVASGLPPCGL